MRYHGSNVYIARSIRIIVQRVSLPWGLNMFLVTICTVEELEIREITSARGISDPTRHLTREYCKCQFSNEAHHTVTVYPRFSVTLS